MSDPERELEQKAFLASMKNDNIKVELPEDIFNAKRTLSPEEFREQFLGKFIGRHRIVTGEYDHD